MPVALGTGDFARWLDAAAQPDALLPLLASRPVEGLEVAAANPLVNSPKQDTPACLASAV
jgi:putative SOS response-associated peptidase YedK